MYVFLLLLTKNFETFEVLLDKCITNKKKTYYLSVFLSCNTLLKSSKPGNSITAVYLILSLILGLGFLFL